MQAPPPPPLPSLLKIFNLSVEKRQVGKVIETIFKWYHNTVYFCNLKSHILVSLKVKTCTNCIIRSVLGEKSHTYKLWCGQRNTLSTWWVKKAVLIHRWIKIRCKELTLSWLSLMCCRSSTPPNVVTHVLFHRISKFLTIFTSGS